MVTKVLIVDDSSVIRGLLASELNNHPDIKVVDTASDGQMAIKMAAKYQPDVILLDLEMPIMRGVDAIPQLIDSSPQAKIIIISSAVRHNMTLVMSAFQLGAIDYIAKPEKNEVHGFFKEVLQKVRALGSGSCNPVQHSSKKTSETLQKNNNLAGSRPFDAIAIASSTGGPRALVTLFNLIRNHKHKAPIFITQHMHHSFTHLFAEELSLQSKSHCIVPSDGQAVEPGKIYLAPGNLHMVVTKDENQNNIISLVDGPTINSCKPSADPMFSALSEIYGNGLLALVLTGMGQDGAKGAQDVARKGGTVIVQDMSTSVVYGMPKAVADLGITQAILPLNEIAEYITKVLR